MRRLRFRAWFHAVCAVSATVGVLVVSGLDVRAYALLGHKWAVNQVLYYINPRNVYMTDAQATTAIQNAASGWTSQSNANIQFVYAGTTSTSAFTLNQKNEVFFRSDSTSQAGETYWWSDANGNLVDTDIAFNQGLYAFSTDGLPCSNALYLQDMAAHEFGHALGLLHSSLVDATMYPTLSAWCDTSWRSLSSDDIAGVLALYPTGGGSTGSAPSAPSSLTASRNTANPTGSLILSWRDNSTNEDRFTLERSLDGNAFAYLTQVGTNTTSFTDQGLASGTTYYYRVYASNGVGNSAYSNTASATTDVVSSTPTLAVRGYKVKRTLKVDLTWSGFSTANVDVYRNGALILTTPNDGAQTDSPKSTGTYTYKLCEAGSTSVCSNQASTTF